MMNCASSKNVVSVFVSLVIITMVQISDSIQGPVPRLIVKGILADSVLVFFSGNGVQFVPQWNLQYRERESNSTIQEVNTTENQYYIYRLHDLKPFTKYEVRARALSIRGGNLTSFNFSNWTTFDTAPYTVFGRVDLKNTKHTSNHETRYSAEWNSTLEILKEGYNATDYESIDVIETGNKDGIVRLHYRINIGGNWPPDITELKLNGSSFKNSFISYKEYPDGTTYSYKDTETKGEKFTLVYVSNSECAKIVERYVVISSENDPDIKIHLNVASSSVTTSDEHDGIVLRLSSERIELLRDDDLSVGSLSRNQIIAITPMFLIKDCLRSGGDEPMYTEVYSATDPTELLVYNYSVYTLKPSAAVLDQSKVTSISVENVTSSFRVPAMKNVIQYSYLNGTGIFATVTDLQTMVKDIWTMKIDSQTSSVLELIPRGTFLKHDGTNYTLNGPSFSSRMRGDECAKCSDFASCQTYVVTGESSCECLDGYTGDGHECVSLTTTGMDLSTLVTESDTTLTADSTTVEDQWLTTEDDGPILLTQTTTDLPQTLQSGVGDHHTLLPPYIILIVAATFVFLIATVLLLLCYRKRRRKDSYKVSKSNESLPRVTLTLQVIETHSAHIVNEQDSCSEL